MRRRFDGMQEGPFCLRARRQPAGCALWEDGTPDGVEAPKTLERTHALLCGEPMVPSHADACLGG